MNIVSWISLYLVATFFFLTANAFALFGVLNADTVKETLRQENAYSAVVPSVLSTASYSEEAAGQLPLQEPGIRGAAQKAFPVSELEQKAGTVIDSTFAWLEGETATPEFRLDFTENKQQLATEIGSYTENRLGGLPRCTLSNLPDTFDPFRIDCLPPGFSAATLGDRVSRQIANDQGFLRDPVISSEELITGNTLAQLDSLRPLYENKTLILWLLPLATIGFAILGLVLARDRPKGFRRMGRSFLFSAIGLFVFALLLGFGPELLIAAVATDALTQNVLSPVITSLAAQAQTIYYVFAGIALAVSAGAFIANRKLAAKAR